MEWTVKSTIQIIGSVESKFFIEARLRARITAKFTIVVIIDGDIARVFVTD